jgi:hypothetical protein
LYVALVLNVVSIGGKERSNTGMTPFALAPILAATICTLLMSTSPGARSNTTSEEIDRRSASRSLGCSGTPINPGDDLEAAKADPLDTAPAFCPEAATYLVDETVVLRQGDTPVDPAGQVSTRPPAPDADGDGIPDASDNCPSVANPGQKDLNGEGIGDVCDSDRDGDGRPNSTDYAPDDPTTQDPQWCPATGRHIFPGDDIDAKINGSNATWCIHAGTYPVDQMVTVAQGDNIYAEPGTSRDIVLPSGEKVYDLTAAVKLTNGGNLSKMINVTADSAVIDWLGGGGAKAVLVDPNGPDCINVSEATGTCAKVGTGMFLGSGSSGPGVILNHMDVSNNAANCIQGLHGVLKNSELQYCSQEPAYDGFTAGAVKTTYESEYHNNYVHNVPNGNGIWCDQGCHNVAERANGFWVHDNLIVKTGGWGVNYEFSPMLAEGVHASSSSALVENNYAAANRTGAAQMLDAQNATFRNNSFGPQTVAGVAYAADGNSGLAILFKDSGRATRTDLWNGDAADNILHGEVIKGCELPDNVVYCHDDNVGRGFLWLRRASIAALIAAAFLILSTIYRTRFLSNDGTRG